MEKKKKLYEPIRRGAPSLPFDFTEVLKKIEVNIPSVNRKQESTYYGDTDNP